MRAKEFIIEQSNVLSNPVVKNNQVLTYVVKYMLTHNLLLHDSTLEDITNNEIAFAYSHGGGVLITDTKRALIIFDSDIKVYPDLNTNINIYNLIKNAPADSKYSPKYMIPAIVNVHPELKWIEHATIYQFDKNKDPSRYAPKPGKYNKEITDDSAIDNLINANYYLLKNYYSGQILEYLNAVHAAVDDDTVLDIIEEVMAEVESKKLRSLQGVASDINDSIYENIIRFVIRHKDEFNRVYRLHAPENKLIQSALNYIYEHPAIISKKMIYQCVASAIKKNLK